MPSDHAPQQTTTTERVRAEFLWALRKWRHTGMTSQELVEALCTSPAFLDLAKAAEAAHVE